MLLLNLWASVGLPCITLGASGMLVADSINLRISKNEKGDTLVPPLMFRNVLPILL